MPNEQLPVTEKVHNYRRISGSNEVRLQAVTPYIRLKESGEVGIFIKQGRFCYEDGEELEDDDLPEWFWKQAARLTPAALEEVGVGEDLRKKIRQRARGANGSTMASDKPKKGIIRVKSRRE